MASAAQRRIKSISYAKYGYMFIAPFFLVYCFFQIWPLIQTFILSFQGNGADAGTFVGFDNYATILFGSGEGMGRRAKAMQELFLTSFKNTIILWFGNFIPQILLSLLLAVWFTDSKLHIPGVGFFKVVMYLPNIITAVSVDALYFQQPAVRSQHTAAECRQRCGKLRSICCLEPRHRYVYSDVAVVW